jgi:hypothetical protein
MQIRLYEIHNAYKVMTKLVQIPNVHALLYCPKSNKVSELIEISTLVVICFIVRLFRFNGNRYFTQTTI